MGTVRRAPYTGIFMEADGVRRPVHMSMDCAECTQLHANYNRLQRVNYPNVPLTLREESWRASLGRNKSCASSLDALCTRSVRER